MEKTLQSQKHPHYHKTLFISRSYSVRLKLQLALYTHRKKSTLNKA